MYGGMTRNEFGGLVALILLIAAGLAASAFMRARQSGLVWEDVPLVAQAQGDAASLKPAPQLLPVDINSATAAELEAVPGLGPERARAIASGRRAGPYRTLEDLDRVPGIGPTTIKRLRGYLTVGDSQDRPTAPSSGESATSATPGPIVAPLEISQIETHAPAPPRTTPADGPVDINRASAEELQRLWNVGPVTAAAIVRWRQENGPFARPRDIVKVHGIGPKTFERNRARITVRPAGKPDPTATRHPDDRR